MDMDELKAKLGAAAADAVAKYGPTVLLMSQSDIQKWIDYVFVGRYTDAYALYLKTASNDALLSEWGKESAAWKADNLANAEKIEMSNAIAQKMCYAMLSIMLALVVV